MNRIKLNRNGSQTRYNLHRVHWAEVLQRKLGAIIIYSAFTGQSCPLRRRERCQEAFLRRHGNEQIELVYKVPIEGALAPWRNVKTEVQNSFSIQGLTNRNFFINRNYGGCHVDTGWLCITSYPCKWEKRYGVNAVLYSKLAIHTNWNIEGEYIDVTN